MRIAAAIVGRDSTAEVDRRAQFRPGQRRALQTVEAIQGEQ